MLQLNTQMLPEAPLRFEQLYLSLRMLEGRIYTDTELRKLPDIAPKHIHFKEWQVRKRSAERLLDYLGKKDKPLNILEVGCGNGWLAAKLAGIKDANVFAIDVNRMEIHQARRVFSKRNLQFFSGGIEQQNFEGIKFDVIVFAASIQYFSPLKETIKTTLQLLAPDGEIHLTDSNFYNRFTMPGAMERTREYYSAMRYPEMADFYFHHRLDELDDFNFRILNNPASLKSLLVKRGPFYWIKIKN